MDLNIKITRKSFLANCTLGEMRVDNIFLGYVLEDTDRGLKQTDAISIIQAKKVHGKTAIPKGSYKVILSMSNRFKKIMPEVLNVPGFAGVRIHGGNTDADTLGCPLLGKKIDRVAGRVSDCATVNADLIRMIEGAIKNKQQVLLTIE